MRRSAIQHAFKPLSTIGCVWQTLPVEMDAMRGEDRFLLACYLAGVRVNYAL